MSTTSPERTAALLGALRDEAQRNRSVSVEVQQELLTHFAQGGLEETAVALCTVRFTELLGLLVRTQRHDDFGEATTHDVIAAFVESAVLLTALIEYQLKVSSPAEAKKVNDERVTAYLQVLNAHCAKQFIRDAASSHIGCSNNYMWVMLVDSIS